MKLVKLGQPRYQCEAIIQPGEFIIDIFDGEQCSQTNRFALRKCEDCEKYFCYLFHWHEHVYSHRVVE